MSNTETEKEDFAVRLVFARESRKLNQTELARLTGLQPAAIGHFEKGRRKPSFANVRALAKALNVSSDYLLGRAESMSGATTVFRGEEKLSSGDRDFIQTMILSMTEKNNEKKGG